jgi:hypothetical protein
MECYKITQSQNKEVNGVGKSIHIIQTKYTKHIMNEQEEIGGKYSKIN